MTAFETTAVLDDASHLTLHDSLPGQAARRCRVIVLFDEAETEPKAWPPGFFEEIRITDPAFKRYPQGELPPAPDLDSCE